MIRNILKVLLSPLLGRIKSRPKSPRLPPLQSDQVHVFAGTFETEAAATDYALGLTDASLAQDLGGVGIGPDDVEIIFGTARLTAARPMFHFTGPPRDPGDANTYILLSDRGYDADTVTGRRVTHLGLCSVS